MMRSKCRSMTQPATHYAQLLVASDPSVMHGGAPGRLADSRSASSPHTPFTSCRNVSYSARGHRVMSALHDQTDCTAVCCTLRAQTGPPSRPVLDENIRSTRARPRRAQFELDSSASAAPPPSCRSSSLADDHFSAVRPVRAGGL